MKIWIIVYNHRHGSDAWPVVSEEQPDLKKISEELDDFEPDRQEYIDSFGPFALEEIERR